MADGRWHKDGGQRTEDRGRRTENGISSFQPLRKGGGHNAAMTFVMSFFINSPFFHKNAR